MKMNEDSFLRNVENSKSCDMALLNDAVNKGLKKAAADSFDKKKVAGVAAAVMVTMGLCLAVKNSPINTIAYHYLEQRTNYVSETFWLELTESINHD